MLLWLIYKHSSNKAAWSRTSRSAWSTWWPSARPPTSRGNLTRWKKCVKCWSGKPEWTLYTLGFEKCRHTGNVHSICFLSSYRSVIKSCKLWNELPPGLVAQAAPSFSLWAFSFRTLPSSEHIIVRIAVSTALLSTIPWGSWIPTFDICAAYLHMDQQRRDGYDRQTCTQELQTSRSSQRYVQPEWTIWSIPIVW